MTNVGYMNHLKENFTLIIFSLFRLNWPRKEFCNSIYKNEFFFFQNTHFYIISARCIWPFIYKHEHILMSSMGAETL